MGVRERAREALVSMGHPPDERAERLLARGVPGTRREAGRFVKLVARAPGKVNLSLFLGPRREDGRHEFVTLYESVSLADEVTVAPVEAAVGRGRVPGVDAPNIVSMALDGLRAGGWDGPACPGGDRETHTGRGRDGRRLGRRGRRVTARSRSLDQFPVPSAVTAAGNSRASLGADVPSQLMPGAALGTGAGEVVETLPEAARSARIRDRAPGLWPVDGRCLP